MRKPAGTAGTAMQFERGSAKERNKAVETYKALKKMQWKEWSYERHLRMIDIASRFGLS